MARKTTQDNIIAAVRKGWGPDAAHILGSGESRSDVHAVIPTGIDVLDYHVLGIGGFPCGRISELFGGEGGGKTSVGLAACAGAQRVGGVAVIVETEHALQTERAKALGVRLEDVVLLQPDTLEEVLGQIESTVAGLPDEQPALILWDSVAATPTRLEVEQGAAPDGLGGGGLAEFARVMARGLRVLCGKLSGKRVALVCVNQTRVRPGVMFGNPEYTPGGNALKFYCSVRLGITGGGAVRVKGDAGEYVGREVRAKCVKHKLIEPFRGAELRLLYADGWDNVWSTLNHAKDLELVPQNARGAGAYEAARRALEKARMWPPLCAVTP